jgi:hypothetical protein
MSNNTVYTPNAVIPMIRRVFPSMIHTSRLDREQCGVAHKYPLIPWEVEMLRGRKFMSRSQLKKRFKELKPSCYIEINKVEDGDTGELENRVSKWYQLPEKFEDFVVELANLADRYGIIKVSNGTLWVKEAKEIGELNLDERVMDAYNRLYKGFTGKAK